MIPTTSITAYENNPLSTLTNFLIAESVRIEYKLVVAVFFILNGYEFEDISNFHHPVGRQEKGKVRLEFQTRKN